MQVQNQNQATQEVKSNVWDCESGLYDSHELKSFNEKIDSAIASRTVSMPHLSVPSRRSSPRKSSMISRSLQKLLRLVFGAKPTSGTFVQVDGCSEFGFYQGGVLPTIPEVWEKGVDSAGTSPEFNSIVRKTGSERYTGTAFGISQV
ncbi:uncharacterized protein LOC131246297 [Magnolia sinica]|uniref:uncharacterized protein LOC131246297 n=1 Tax=Magnolia sinica TaxID=86752 RepID=UPI00265B4954|nr:uncharacterized protein LOC131246297 [Magnolia sinica]